MNARPLFQDYKNGRKSPENTLHLDVEFFFLRENTTRVILGNLKMNMKIDS